MNDVNHWSIVPGLARCRSGVYAVRVCPYAVLGAAGDFGNECRVIHLIH